jgi:hypothetical protein
MATDNVTPPQDTVLWPAISWLAGISEPERRSVLRSHAEAEMGFDSRHDEAMVNRRKQLDGELERLAALELRAQTAVGHAGADAVAAIRGIPALAMLVRESPSFARYLNVYLFFGVRFAAGRLDPNPAAVMPDGERFNERPAALPAPPACEGRDPAQIEKAAERFLNITLTPKANEALEFLDGIHAPGETTKFELWLRGLYFNANDEPRFLSIVQGLYEWAGRRRDFYVTLEEQAENEKHLARWREGAWVEGKWKVANPVAARCGVVDLYWMARILRAEVSPRGVVRYQDGSWLSYLPSLKTQEQSYGKDEILRIEEVLRSVFDFACDLIQNAVEMAECRERQNSGPAEPPGRPPTTVDWRAAFDLEVSDIANQRRERIDLDQPTPRGQAGFAAQPASAETAWGRFTQKLRELMGRFRRKPRGPVTSAAQTGRAETYWSRRVRSGESEEHLVGLALSGGGIRSATFGLGVLQRLKELDLLRQIDYLSTVSGGGYIGAWLLGNVRRTRYWLTDKTSWEESIGHLRRYSRYLAPQTGLLSADTWVIWGTWIRNAFLIQLTAVAWLAALFVMALELKSVFDSVGSGIIAYTALTAGFVGLAGIIVKSLLTPSLQPTQHGGAVLLAWAGSFLTAALLWQRVVQPGYVTKRHYSEVLTTAFHSGSFRWSMVFLLICLFALAYISFLTPWKPLGPRKLLGAVGAALLGLSVVYLALCGIIYLFDRLAQLDAKYFEWYAYVFGPTLVMLAVTLAVVVFIGLMGAAAPDWKREWWTRYGSWLAMYGVIIMAIGLAAVFGPVWVGKLFDHQMWSGIKWGAMATWVGSVVAGLMAGRSDQTKGNGHGSSQALEWVARISGVIFIVGAVLAISSLLRFAMVQIRFHRPGEWWLDMDKILAHSIPLLSVKTSFNEVLLAVLLGCAVVFSWRFDLNTFGLNQFYRNRLVRCYLGATRWKPGWRRPEGFTGFDDDDDLSLAALKYQSTAAGEHFRGPFPLLNCSLNLGGSADLSVHTRQSASFTMTPLSCGTDRPKVGYAPVGPGDGFAGSPTLGQAISISGAAASPNMGYNTSPLVAVLLTIFNVRLAWWFPNPGGKKWNKDSPFFSLSYLVLEFLGLANENSDFVNVSDGGHFENLGIYELVRRRAKVIIAADAERDPNLAFGSLGNVIRICETDFGAKIDINLAALRKQADTGFSHSHCAVGRITYSNGSRGYLVYLKSSITGDEGVGVEQYRAVHPDFPHQSTGDQFFSEDQFESYRLLGYHITRLAFCAGERADNMVECARKLYDLWAPAGFSSSAFMSHTKALDLIWERFRNTSSLHPLLRELTADNSWRVSLPLRSGVAESDENEELCACLELIQLMENVFINLRLDDFWEHPDNRGWAMLFTMWAKSPRFRTVWNKMRRTFGIRFEYFCGHRLGLETDNPVARIK